MRQSKKLEAARNRAYSTRKYRVIRDEDGTWAVVNHMGYSRPAVTWQLAMGSVPARRVAA